jgi:AcrR family transcriptional regulator
VKQSNEPRFEQPAVSGPAAPRSRRDERDMEYRQRILHTASELFEKQGIEGVTMYQIAQEAGVGQGTLYRRYTHVGEVCSELMHTSVETFIQSLEANLSQSTTKANALGQLSDILSLIVDFIDQKAPLLHTIDSMYMEKKHLCFHEKPVFKRLHAILATLIIRAVEQKIIRDVDVTLTVNVLLSALSPRQYLYHKDVLGYSKEEFTSGIRRLFVEGL